MRKIMKKAVELAKKMTGDWTARMKMALKMAWADERGQIGKETKAQELITKYNLKLKRKNGRVGFVAANKYMKDEKIVEQLKNNKEDIKAELLKREEEQKKKEEEKVKKLEEKYQDGTELEVIFSYRFGMLTGEFADTKRGKELLKNVSKRVIDKIRNTLEQEGYQSEINNWDTLDQKYRVTVGDLEKYINQAKKEVEEEKEQARKEEEQKLEEIKNKAKETGERQVLRSTSAPCDSPKEECDIDNVVTFIYPDGSEKVERHHTW